MIPHTSGSEELLKPAVGGALLNTAIALGRLDENVNFISGISTDLFGKQIKQYLQQSNVKLDNVKFSDDPTTLAFVSLDSGQAQYTFYNENTALRLFSPSKLDSASLSGSTFVFGGISLIDEPCASGFENFMQEVAPHSLCYIDPNIRANFVSDGAAFKGRITRMIANADIVKISDEDLDYLAQGTSFDAMIDGWLTSGTALVALTKGQAGVEMITKDFRVSVRAETAIVVDTIGAGDSFNAGVLSALRQENLLSKSDLHRITLEQAKTVGAFAAKIAARTVSKAGANPPWLSELS